MGKQRRILEIAADLASAPLSRASSERLGTMLNAATESAADELPTATRAELERDLRAASAVLSAIRSNHRIDRTSPDFLAGRLAALADLYGYATTVTADEEIATVLDNPSHRAVFDSVAAGTVTSPEIAEECGLTLADTRAVLAELCCASIIVKFRQGDYHDYSLTPIGRLLSDSVRPQYTNSPRL